jgi:hypothetical protein
MISGNRIVEISWLGNTQQAIAAMDKFVPGNIEVTPVSNEGTQRKDIVFNVKEK